jgi:tetratricopeptide (TPR) repeat protein
MRCPECKADVPDNLSLCPECGEMVQDTRPTRRTRRPTGPMETRPIMRAMLRGQDDATVPVAASFAEPVERRPVWGPMLRVALMVLGALTLLALSVVLGGYLGLHRGEVEREEARLQEARTHFEKGEALLSQGEYKLAVAEYQYVLKLEADHAFALQRIDEIVAMRYRVGMQYLENGDYELAIAEFEYILQIKPDHPYAPQGITEAQTRLAASLTPTPIDVETVKLDIFQQAVVHYEAEEWEEAAATLNQLRALDMTYEAVAVEDMLFNSHYNAGMALLAENRFEEGIFHLDQAIAMRPSDPLAEKAQWERDLAELYMVAMGYWAVDWERCIARFETLYALAPNYKDTYDRLYLAHVSYGDEWYGKNEMCPAEEQYTLALDLGNSEEVKTKRDQAAAVCLVATPTPIESLAGSEVITLTELPRGFGTGRLAFPTYNSTSDSYDIYVLSTDGRIVRWVSGGTHPTWMRSSRSLGYRNLVSPGISLLASATDEPRQLRSGVMSWPTFSPDGGRMAYASQDGSGTWQVYIAPMDGSAEPQIHAAGKWPTWGKNGWLAWTGCDDSGACGIFIDNPDDDQAPTQLSTSTDDIAMNWHPDGVGLIYMAKHTGNWEIYRVNTDRTFMQLTDNPASDGLPVWSPDGSKIAFVSDRDGEWGVYLMESNGEDPHVILALGPDMPSWTSQRLAWGP